MAEEDPRKAILQRYIDETLSADEEREQKVRDYINDTK